MSLRVLRAGLLDTVQDAGRYGRAHLGVGRAGALDAHARAIANLLVGNRADAAVLETTLQGPTLRFEAAARIAVCGATIDARVDGTPLPGWRPADVPAGATLALGRCIAGARACLAVAGGLDVPRVLGSRSTDLRGGFGGHAGRALRGGDVLPVGASAIACDAVRVARWWIDPAPDLDFDAPCVVRVLPGSDATAPPDALCAQPWRVAAASDRQGLRLDGMPLAVDGQPRERSSEPVVPGTVQLPPDGKPIVLLADAQTHGGYPRIGHVVCADWPKLAQLRPGEALHFSPCTPAQAAAALRAQRQRLARIAIAVAGRGPDA